MTLAEFVKMTREARGLSKAELASIADISPSYLGRIEAGLYKTTSIDTLTKLARALRVSFDDIKSVVISKNKSKVKTYIPKPKSLSDITKELLNELPIMVPVIADMHAPGQIIEYVFIPKQATGHTKFYGVKIRGDCMSPRVEDGDIIVIDKDDVAEIGKTVLCYHNGKDQPSIFRMKKTSDVEDCEIYGVVIWIMKKP